MLAMGNSFESGKRVEKKEMESTAQESAVMDRYIDLRAKAYDALMSDEERKEFAQDLIDLVRTLNEGKEIDSEVREDLLKNVHAIEMNYLDLKQAAETVKRLERESRGGILVPHLYQKSIGLIQTALGNGVPEGALDPLKRIIEEYLQRVHSR